MLSWVLGVGVIGSAISLAWLDESGRQTATLYAHSLHHHLVVMKTGRLGKIMELHTAAWTWTSLPSKKQ
jgi:hypothetical protein